MRAKGGVDGCPAGWVMATVMNGAAEPVEVYASISELTRPQIQGIGDPTDMLIGLSEEDGGRLCDRLGREARACDEVRFFQLPQAVLAETYEEACAAHQVVTGTEISKQARFDSKSEIDDFLRAIHMVGLGSESVIRLAFAGINGGEPLHPKKHRGFLDRPAPRRARRWCYATRRGDKPRCSTLLVADVS